MFSLMHNDPCFIGVGCSIEMGVNGGVEVGDTVVGWNAGGVGW